MKGTKYTIVPYFVAKHIGLFFKPVDQGPIYDTEHPHLYFHRKLNKLINTGGNKKFTIKQIESITLQYKYQNLIEDDYNTLCYVENNKIPQNSVYRYI